MGDVADDTTAVSGPDDRAKTAQEVLDGIHGLTSVADAAAILADCEAIGVIAEPLDGILAVAVMILGVWRALETPHRTLAYQGYAYGLLRACAGMTDPTPNKGWPDPGDVDNDYSDFDKAVAKAKTDAQDTKLCNRILLAMAKFGEGKVLKDVWDKIVADDDHLLRMFTPQWPDVAPG